MGYNRIGGGGGGGTGSAPSVPPALLGPFTANQVVATGPSYVYGVLRTAGSGGVRLRNGTTIAAPTTVLFNNVTPSLDDLYTPSPTPEDCANGVYLELTGSGCTCYLLVGAEDTAMLVAPAGSTPEEWTPVATTTYTLGGADTRLYFTHASGCTITCPAGLSANVEWLCAQKGGPLTVVASGSTIVPATSIGTSLVGSVLSLSRTPTTDEFVAAGYSGLEQNFATLAALQAWGSANPSLLVANVSRAWVLLSQYGWNGTSWVGLTAMKHYAQALIGAFTIDGVSQGGSNPFAWVVPANVYEIEIFRGAGGGGGGGAGFNGSSGGGGGGGGAGQSILLPLKRTVVPGETLTMTIGAGGTGGVSGGASATGGEHTTISGSTSGLLAFLSGGGNGGAGTATNGGSGSGQRVGNVVSGGSAGTGAAGAGNTGIGQSGGTLMQGSGGGGGGATGTNNGGDSGTNGTYAYGTGGTAASTLGGGGAGGTTNMLRSAVNGVKRTGGNTTESAAPALVAATDGYGLGGGGGGARSGGGNGAAGTDGMLAFSYAA